MALVVLAAPLVELIEQVVVVVVPADLPVSVGSAKGQPVVVLRALAVVGQMVRLPLTVLQQLPELLAHLMAPVVRAGLEPVEVLHRVVPARRGRAQVAPEATPPPLARRELVVLVPGGLQQPDFRGIVLMVLAAVVVVVARLLVLALASPAPVVLVQITVVAAAGRVAFVALEHKPQVLVVMALSSLLTRQPLRQRFL